ncbi:MAG: hypothetical protein HY289_06690 [Planctomycetes bacterium]|nr:hypothetical protein [Planctomycetota bacterium]
MVLARVDQIPLGVKDELLLKPIIDAIDAAEKIAQPGETKTQNEFRLAALHDLKQFAASIVKDAAEIRFDLDVSDKTNELAVSLDIKARPGSGLAKTFKNLGDLKSPLGSIVDRDTAFLGGTHIVLPDALSQAFIKVVREARDGALKGIQDDVKKAQAKSLFDSLMPTAEAGEFQMVVAAVGPKQERYALLGALKLKDGAKLGKTVFDLLTNARENIPKDQRDKVKVPLKSVGAVMIHRFELPKDVAIDKFLDGIVGPERYLYLAFRNDAMFLGLGKESETLPALESAIGKTQNAASSPLAFTVDVARLAPLLARTENQKDLATRQFPSGSTGRLRLTLDGGASLTLRLQMGLNVLEFLVKMKDLKE